MLHLRRFQTPLGMETAEDRAGYGERGNLRDTVNTIYHLSSGGNGRGPQ